MVYAINKFKHYITGYQVFVHTNNITWKSTTGFTPYELVYGKKPLLPIEFEIQTLRLAMEVGLNLTKAQKKHNITIK